MSEITISMRPAQKKYGAPMGVGLKKQQPNLPTAKTLKPTASKKITPSQEEVVEEEPLLPKKLGKISTNYQMPVGETLVANINWIHVALFVWLGILTLSVIIYSLFPYPVLQTPVIPREVATQQPVWLLNIPFNLVPGGTIPLSPHVVGNLTEIKACCQSVELFWCHSSVAVDLRTGYASIRHVDPKLGGARCILYAR